jgi:hypothetical protein
MEYNYGSGGIIGKGVNEQVVPIYGTIPAFA